jgi:hypothetical protein
MASKTYFNDGGVIINSAMFITPDGSQYPVRNISAVRMKSEDRLGWIIASVVFLIIGVSGGPSFLPLMLLLVTLCLGVWFFGRNFQLIISSGGVEVAALSYNQREKNKKEFLTRALSSLSLAITDLQS